MSSRLGFCARCGQSAELELHHRKLRSRGGDDSEANLVGICRDCHGWIHANPAEATARGWMVSSWDDPATVELIQLTVDGREIPHEQVVGGHGLEGLEVHDHVVKPGEKCPTCRRRVNHPKKDASPQSKVTSMRMPAEAAETFEETLEACAEHAGVKTTEKYWKHKVVFLALGYLLQTDTRALRRELEGRGG